MRGWFLGRREYGYGFIDATEYMDTPWLGFAINKISAPDSLDPHDHPQSFVSIVWNGAYTERIWDVPGRPGEFRDVKRPRFSIHLMKNTAAHNILEVHGEKATTLFFKLRAVRESPRFWVDGRPWEIYAYMEKAGLGRPTGRGVGE
jgi:hypothetical protein